MHHSEICPAPAINEAMGYMCGVSVAIESFVCFLALLVFLYLLIKRNHFKYYRSFEPKSIYQVHLLSMFCLFYFDLCEIYDQGSLGEVGDFWGEIVVGKFPAEIDQSNK